MFSERQDKPYTSADVRFTTKGETLYAVLLDWPESGEVTIKSLGGDLRLYAGEIGSVALLGSGEVDWSRTGEGLRVRLPGERPCESAFALEIRPKETPSD